MQHLIDMSVRRSVFATQWRALCFERNYAVFLVKPSKTPSSPPAQTACAVLIIVSAGGTPGTICHSVPLFDRQTPCASLRNHSSAVATMALIWSATCATWRATTAGSAHLNGVGRAPESVAFGCSKHDTAPVKVGCNRNRLHNAFDAFALLPAAPGVGRAIGSMFGASKDKLPTGPFPGWRLRCPCQR